MTQTTFQGVLFDLDGTLLDTAPDFIAVVNQLRIHHSLPHLPDEIVRAQVSNGAGALVRLALTLEETSPDFQDKRQQLLTLYESHLSIHTQPFPGVQALLTQLDQDRIPWGIVTNKPVQYAKPLLQQQGLLDRSACLICPDHVTHRKPHPEPLFKACEAMNVMPDQCVYIGDHKRDIDAGRNAGMITIAALYGYIAQNEQPETWQADYYARNSTDLCTIIYEHNTTRL